MEMQSMYFSSTCKSYSKMFTILQIKFRQKSTNQNSTISLTKLSMNTYLQISATNMPKIQIFATKEKAMIFP